MIADTVMGIFELSPHDPVWFQDRTAVSRALDAVLDTPLGGLVSYAGKIRRAKPAPDRRAVHALVATGNDDLFVLQDAKRPQGMYVGLTIVLGNLHVRAECFGPELTRRPNAVDDVAAVGVALRACDVFAGMSVGYVRPLLQSYASYEHERSQPRVSPCHSGLRSGAILDLIDVRFHSSSGPYAEPAEVRLAGSDIPDRVKRSEHDGLVRFDWISSMADKQGLDRACEGHEDWLDRNLRI